ncbi:unnamed protein product, partial [Owenia fusiformis]
SLNIPPILTLDLENLYLIWISTRKAEMVELVDGSGVFVSQITVAAISKPKMGGKQIARVLLGKLFTKDELLHGTISKTAEKYLNPILINTIISYARSRDAYTPVGQLRTAICNKC